MKETEMDIVIEEAKDGNPTMKINDLYIHSKYSPIKEAEQIAEVNYKPHHLHVIYGYGLGYIVEHLVKKFKFNEPILIIDPLIDAEKLTLKEMNYKRIYYTSSDNYTRVSSFLSELSSYSNKVHVIIQQNYQHLNQQHLIDMLKLVKDSQIRELYNVNTINLFSLNWQLNSFINTKFIYNDYSLKELFDRYDTPIVIASGGPSLNKQLNLLKENRERIILICAGTTINTLLKNNIYPDYVVSIDGGEINYSHFEGIDTQDIELLYVPTNNRNIRDCFKADGFAFIPNGMDALRIYYEKKTNKDLPPILGGGSVAHYALSIAKKLTTAPVCLIGQDLAYTNNMSHAEGNKGIKHYSDIVEEVVEVDSYDGGKVKSSNSFKTMITTFEQLQLFDIHRNEVFNCTEGGAKINLIPPLPFATFIERYCTKKVERVKNKKENKQKFDLDKFYIEEVKNYNQIIELLNEGIAITEPEEGPYFNTSVLNDLLRIEKILNELYIEHNVDALLEPIIIKNEVKFLPKVEETKDEEFKRVKNYTITLYQDCIDRIKEYINILEKEMRK